RNTRRRPRPLAKIDKPKSDMKASSGTVWKKSSMIQKRRFAANVMKTALGLKQGIKPQTPLAAFRLFFNDIAIELILLYTNQKLQAIKDRETRSSFLQKSRNFQKEEILGFIGFLITAGAYKDNKDPVDEILSEEGLPIYRATLAKHRFLLLLKCIRFDDKNTREGRKEHDNFAAIRELWNNVTDTFPKFLNPSESVVIDEELITFHGRCKFRVFIPKNLEIEPYVGKCENQPKGYNSGPEVVKRLVALAKIENSGRNITMDRKFTSLATTAELFEKKLTVVGTIASTRRDVPLELRPQSLNKSLPGTIRFAFRDKETLVSYVPKRNKFVTVLSSQHRDIQVTEDKPEIIMYYNSTKAGVDTLDKCVRQCSCRRTNESWTAQHPKHKSGRKKFLKSLGKELCKINMENRSRYKGLNKSYAAVLRIFKYNCQQGKAITRGSVIKEPEGPATRAAIKKLPKKRRCFVCPRSEDRKYMKIFTPAPQLPCARHRLHGCECPYPSKFQAETGKIPLLHPDSDDTSSVTSENAAAKSGQSQPSQIGAFRNIATMLEFLAKTPAGRDRTRVTP
ncbi:hypothetical protein ILUMI_17606, partial [Ignelater luminosus]